MDTNNDINVVTAKPKRRWLTVFSLSAAAFVDRHGAGPTSLSALRTLLAETRQRGYAVESGEVTPGLSSVAVAALDHNEHPLAGVAVTYETGSADPEELAAEVARTARLLSARLGGRA